MFEGALSRGRYCTPLTFTELITPPSPPTCPADIEYLFYNNEYTTPIFIYICGAILSFYVLRLCMGNSASHLYKKTANYLRGTGTEYTGSNSAVVLRERKR
eukprot:sb/3478440/